MRRFEIADPAVATAKKRAQNTCARLKGAKLRACRTRQARRRALARCRKLKGAARVRCERKARAIGAAKRAVSPSRPSAARSR